MLVQGDDFNIKLREFYTEFNAFYTKFIQTNSYYQNNNMPELNMPNISTDNSNSAEANMETVPTVPAYLDEWHNKLNQLLHVSSTSPPCTTKNTVAPLTTTMVSDDHDNNACHNNEQNNRDCYDNACDHSFGASTPSTNKNKHPSLLAAPNTADSAMPATDDPNTIKTFLSKLEDLHNELLQLLHPSSTSPSCTSPTEYATLHNKRTSSYHTTIEHDNSNIDDMDRKKNNPANGNSTTASCKNDDCTINDSDTNK